MVGRVEKGGGVPIVTTGDNVPKFSVERSLTQSDI